MMTNWNKRVVVFSFNGVSSKCGIVKYYCAVLWRKLRGYDPLTFIGSYVS